MNISHIRKFALSHKFISGAAIIVVLIALYYGYGALFGKKSATSYLTSAVTKGTITQSISGSGQVSALNTVSLQFKASGTLVYLPIQNGQTVQRGQLLAQLDTSDAQKSIISAQSSLQSAQISLQKLEGSGLSVPKNKQDAIDALNQDYQSAYNTISNAFVDLPSIMTDLQDVIYGYAFNNTTQNIYFYGNSTSTLDPTSTQFTTKLTSSYKIALSDYTQNFSDYKNSSRTSDNTTIDSLLSETYSTSRDIAQAIKDTNNLIQFYKDTFAKYNYKTNPIADTQLTTINADLSKINSNLTNLFSSQNTIKNDKDAVATSELDLQSQQLSVQNSQNSLQSAKDTLSDYYIYAPFSGTVGKIGVQKGTQVSSGTSVATLLTTQKICVIPLNEVDVSKVKAGQKVVLTFDALPDLTVAGEVATIDPVGTVSQGVVTYNVQINFSTQDERVKSGMSISAEIITNLKQDVLMVPNSAVKTQGTTKYVQVLTNNVPESKAVTVGISNDTSTEITSGLAEGDNVITQTISSGASKTSTTTSGSGLRIPGITGGGNFRGN